MGNLNMPLNSGQVKGYVYLLCLTQMHLLFAHKAIEVFINFLCLQMTFIAILYYYYESAAGIRSARITQQYSWHANEPSNHGWIVH